jgi:hypothetical protein
MRDSSWVGINVPSPIYVRVTYTVAYRKNNFSEVAMKLKKSGRLLRRVGNNNIFVGNGITCHEPRKFPDYLTSLPNMVVVVIDGKMGSKAGTEKT